MRVPSIDAYGRITPEILERHTALQNRDMIPPASFDVKTSLMTRIIGLVVSPQIVMKLQPPDGVHDFIRRLNCHNIS
jgi:hypothetical protein